jgi:VWFA-related protein
MPRRNRMAPESPGCLAREAYDSKNSQVVPFFPPTAMRNVQIVVLAFSLCLQCSIASFSRAQSEAQATGLAASQSGAGLLLKAETPLVMVDVVVTDSHGQPMRSLTQEDFSVFEDGHRITPQSLEEHRADLAQGSAPAPVERNLGQNEFSDIGPAPPADLPLTVLLLDALNTQVADQAEVHRQMLDCVAKLPPGTRMAIFGLTTRLFLLQGFTSDPAILKAALSSRKDLPQKSPMLVSPAEAKIEEEMSAAAPPGFSEFSAQIAQFDHETAAGQASDRTQSTFAAMYALARYLSVLPGRKNLIWFSSSFPLNEAAADELSKAQVSVYPVDAGGISNNPYFSSFTYVPPHNRPIEAGYVNRSAKEFFAQKTDVHSAMDQIAEQTGGKAFYNTNGLGQAVETAMEQGSNYYALAYVPENRKWDGAFRTIKVTVDRPGVRLAYRRGYYGDNPAFSAAARKALHASFAQSSMMFGAPESTEIPFDVAVDPAGDQVAAAPDGNHLAPEVKPPYRLYSILYASLAHNLTFVSAPGGGYRASVEFVAVLYDASGQRINYVTSAAKDFSAAEYKSLLAHGMLFRQEIVAPASGEYFLRLGMLDDSTDRAGVVEIPLSSIRSRPGATAAK